jgi:hypothetical protein
MDHSTPEIAINGRRHALLPVSWWVSALTDFDPLIPVTTWPPEGAAYRGSAKWVDEDLKRASSLELYIAGGRFTDLAGLRKRYPHLDPAEHVFFARATIEGKLYQGAVRVKILGPEGAVFRYVTFDPSSSDEDPRFKRAVWFEKD